MKKQKAPKKPLQAQDYFRQGMADLLSEEPYEALRAYAKGLHVSQTVSELEVASASVSNTCECGNVAGSAWVKRLLLIGEAVRFSSTDLGKAAFRELEKNATKPDYGFKEPVVIIAGGTSFEVETQVQKYANFLLGVFNEFKGTVISGGTRSGVSGLVGQVQKAYPNTVHTVGYLPKTTKSSVDKRYFEIRFTAGTKFSPTEPLQYWTDIVASGIKPECVKLLGINGGRISSLEYRMALAFGAQVNVILGSGLEADKLALDRNWKNAENLTFLVPI